MTILPSLFIGSSSEGLHVAERLQQVLEPHVEATIWSQGVFGLGGGTLETLVDQAARFDYAALVVTPDDTGTKRGVSRAVARDNVLLEIGLFIGILGRFRTFLVLPRKSEVDL